MALVHINASSTTTPSLLFKMPAGLPDTAVQVCNNHTAVLYVGDASVSTSGANRGSQVAVNATQQIWLRANDEIWSIVASATVAGAISIIYSGI